MPRPMGEWDVLIKDQHEAYITWEEFERNQRVIANNATGEGSAVAKGAVRGASLSEISLTRGTRPHGPPRRGRALIDDGPSQSS